MAPGVVGLEIVVVDAVPVRAKSDAVPGPVDERVRISGLRDHRSRGTVDLGTGDRPLCFEARDAALDLLRKRLEAGRPVTGAEVDQAARNVVARAGYGEAFLHRTGHSIGLRAHGDGVNNDDFETHDGRRHLPDTCFSIEPGIYLAGRFGVRSEIDVCLPGGKVELRGGAGQTAVPALLAP